MPSPPHLDRPHRSRGIRTAALALAALLAAGCAGPRPEASAADAQAAEAELRERHAADLATCQAYAQQIGVVQETLDGIVQGAIIAAALVWGAGQRGDVARDWAVAGGVLGSTQGLNALERRRQAVATCLAARGHAPGAVAAAPQPLPTPALPREPALASAAPPSGTDGFSAERLARAQSCSVQPVATLAAKGPGFETYSVACDNGDALAVRCEFGNCRVLR
mgnify:CR=1 FL=1